MILDGPGHFRRGLARADHDGAPLRGSGQARRQQLRRVGGVKRGVEEAAQEGQGIAGKTQNRSAMVATVSLTL
jgi:hypothetical protein